MERHYLHFNAAALVDAAKAYEQELHRGAKMMVTLAGAMSTAELGRSLAEMIKGRVHVICCTGRTSRRTSQPGGTITTSASPL
jgi:deoxyhypusine synthase